RRRRRRHGAFEPGEHDVNGIQVAGGKTIHQWLRQLGRVLERWPVTDVHALRRDVPLGELEEADAFLPYQVQLGVSVLRLELFQAPPGFPDQVGVEGPTEAAVRGDEQQRRAPHAR